MAGKTLAVLSGLALCCMIGAAQAGPCKEADAGSGPTPGASAKAGSAQPPAPQHPPTATMDLATQGKAASPEDAQRQQQGQPTAGEQAMGAKPKKPNC